MRNKNSTSPRPLCAMPRCTTGLSHTTSLRDCGWISMTGIWKKGKEKPETKTHVTKRTGNQCEITPHISAQYTGLRVWKPEWPTHRDHSLQSRPAWSAMCSVCAAHRPCSPCRDGWVVCVPHSFLQCHCPLHRQPVCVRSTINTWVIVRRNNTGHDLVCFGLLRPISLSPSNALALVHLPPSLRPPRTAFFLWISLHRFLVSVWPLCSCQLVELLLTWTEREVGGNRGRSAGRSNASQCSEMFIDVLEVNVVKTLHVVLFGWLQLFSVNFRMFLLSALKISPNDPELGQKKSHPMPSCLLQNWLLDSAPRL